MRVGIDCFVLRQGVSGVEQCLMCLLTELLERAECEYFLYALNNSSIFDAMPTAHACVREAPVSEKATFKRVFYQHFLLNSLASKDALNVFHAPSYVAPFMHRKVPLILTVHDLFAITRPEVCSTLNRIHFCLRLRKSLKQAHCIIVPSQVTKAQVESFEKSVSGRVSVIPWGVDRAFFHDAGTKGVQPVWLQQWTESRPYVLHVGQIEPKKNIPLLLQGFERFKQAHDTDHCLLQVGARGWDWAHVSRDWQQMKHGNDVRFLGPVIYEDLIELYKHADAFVFPSLDEGFGLPPLEAMASNVPVVVSRKGALPEVCGKAATYIDELTSEAICEGLVKVLCRASGDTKLKEAARTHAASFTWSKTAAMTEAVYQQFE